jgi:hypothetical protein
MGAGSAVAPSRCFGSGDCVTGTRRLIRTRSWSAAVFAVAVRVSRSAAVAPLLLAAAAALSCCVCVLRVPCRSVGAGVANPFLLQALL